MKSWRIILLYALTVIVGGIAVRAEYLNARAGYYLPRNHEFDTGKWREWRGTEAQWRRSHRVVDADGRPATRELTAAEGRQMVDDMTRDLANARLREWIETAGLLQHLLLPLLLAAIFIATGSPLTKRRIFSLAPAMLVLLCAFASLCYRGYFTSLGL